MSLFGFIPSAYAQTATPPADSVSSVLQGPLPLLAIMGLIFYFLVFRPQQQRAKQHKAEMAALKRGDSVITAGGIIGTVSRVINDDEVSVEIAEGIRVRVVRSTITGVTGKGEPRPDPVDKAPANQSAKPARRGKQAADVEGNNQG
jgi:preprotein translocase subunit YajC